MQDQSSRATHLAGRQRGCEGSPIQPHVREPHDIRSSHHCPWDGKRVQQVFHWKSGTLHPGRFRSKPGPHPHANSPPGTASSWHYNRPNHPCIRQDPCDKTHRGIRDAPSIYDCWEHQVRHPDISYFTGLVMRSFHSYADIRHPF
jgi:hypothetical protein